LPELSEEEALIQEKTIKEEEEKYRCDLCSKRFKGPEFVNKHIRLKHPDVLAESAAVVRRWRMRTHRATVPADSDSLCAPVAPQHAG